MDSKFPLALLVGATLALSACFDDDGRSWQIAGVDPPGQPPGANTPPMITGTPPAHVLEGEPYEFVPTAADADGDSLEFSITRKPAWASFDRTTGRLSGTPDAEDVGNFTNIAIAVSDGQASASLGNFDVSVNQIALGAATISWTPPTENADGTTLTNLAGYRIYYGRSPTTLNQSVALNNPGLTRYVVENLTPAIWHFVMTSVNAQGVESTRSATVNKTIT